MKLFLIGLSHHTAPVALREKLAAGQNNLADLYQKLTEGLASRQIGEGIFLFTCNRVEFLGAAKDIAAAQTIVHKLFSEVSGVPESEFIPFLYLYEGAEAVRHIFRVASSLDSLIVGEPQILGQTKAAYKSALKYRSTGPLLTKLMHKCFSTAKRVRTETGLSNHAVSVAYAAVELARQYLGSICSKQVLLLGAGEMAELAAQHLKSQGAASLFVASRTLAKAEEVAAQYGGQAVPWAKVDILLSQVDIVIGSTGSVRPVITKELLTPILAKRAEKPLFFIDIAVPRDIEDEVGFLPLVTLKDIDHLKEVVAKNIASRQKEAKRAEDLIEQEVESYLTWAKGLSAWPTIAALTQKAEDLRRLELSRTLPRLALDPAQRAAIEVMTNSLVKRLLHDPITFVKNSGRHGQEESNLYLARRILGLDEPED